MTIRQTNGYLQAKSPILYQSERRYISLLENLGVLYCASYWSSDNRRILLFSIPSRTDGEDTVTIEANLVSDFYYSEFDKIAESYREFEHE